MKRVGEKVILRFGAGDSRQRMISKGKPADHENDLTP
jgi:hypothetical protein